MKLEKNKVQGLYIFLIDQGLEYSASTEIIGEYRIHRSIRLQPYGLNLVGVVAESEVILPTTPRQIPASNGVNFIRRVAAITLESLPADERQELQTSPLFSCALLSYTSAYVSNILLQSAGITQSKEKKLLRAS